VILKKDHPSGTRSLAEQWQDELDRKFKLPFDILTNGGLRLRVRGTGS
jgi:hypothetical protein